MEMKLACTPKRLPEDLLIAAAKTAVSLNPVNHPPLHRLTRIVPGFAPTKLSIAVLTTKYWGNAGVSLSVGFMDNPPIALRKKLLQHMNAWSATANVKFVETKTDPQVRIAREGGEQGGYWSYLGTDILHIPKAKQTMNLEAFSLNTPDSEYVRVVRHETGHTLGFPHEHMRNALVQKIDPTKAIEYFMRTQGWSEQEVRQQVLTPIEESSLLGTKPDPKSIMCYQIPGFLTKDGKPILGGKDIDASDATFAAIIYPKKPTKGPLKFKKAQSKKHFGLK